MNIRSIQMENISDKKKAIFESTLELIQEHGFHGAPMSLVAKNAGVAAGTIYHYFESKDKLICELYTYNKARISDIISEILDESIPYKEKFYEIWLRIYGFYVENTNVLTFFEQYINSPYNASKYPNHFKGELYNFFKEGVEKGEVKDVRPEILMVLILGSVNSTAKLHKFAQVPVSEEEIHRIIDILWHGISNHTSK